MIGAVVPPIVSPISPVDEKSNISHIEERVNMKGANAIITVMINNTFLFIENSMCNLNFGNIPNML